MQEKLIFIIALLIPMLLFRICYKILDYYKLSLSIKKYKIHHAHLGILLILMASVILLFLDKNIYVIILLGLGLGLVLDESIAIMIIKTTRGSDLKAYEKGFIKTIILFILIISIILILSLI